MPIRSTFVSLTALALAGGAGAQQPRAAGAATHLMGAVSGQYGPADEALVELLRGSAVVRTARTHSDGRFDFDGVASGEYRLRVRRIGYDPYDNSIQLVGPVDSIRVVLVDGRATRDSIAHADFERRLAAARARPRHWNCNVPSADVHSRAVAAYYEFFSTPGMETLGREYGMPSERDAFLRNFRTVSDARECRRLAEALDRQQGLIDDQLYVFRVGRVYFLPGPDGGMIVDLSGKIIAVFMVG